MHKHDVRSPEQALAYITDCTLATVADLAMRKSRPKHEYTRQKAIAQQAITWMDNMRIDYSGTRASDVREAGSVDAWAERIEV